MKIKPKRDTFLGTVISRNVSFVIGLIICVIPANCFAVTANDVYEKYRKSVLESDVYETDKYIFSCGKTTPHKETTFSRKIAINKSYTLALTGFYRVIRLQIKWPEILDERLHNTLFEQFIDLSGIKLNISRALKVDHGFNEDEGGYFTVLAISKQDIKYKSLTYSQIVSTLDNAFEHSDKRLKNSIYLEICPANKIERVIPRLAAQLGKEHGQNIEAVTSGVPVEMFADFSAIDKINFSDLATKTYDTLFALLEICPYYPRLCLALGKRMADQGRNRNANLFFLRGTVWQIDPENNLRCKNAMSEEYFKAALPGNYADITGLKDKVASARSDKTTILFGTNAEAIVASMGTIPIKDSRSTTRDYTEGNSFFNSSPPDIDKALQHYLAEIEKNISADVCNMIGCSLRVKKQYFLSLPFLFQATVLNQRHRYAWVNLSLVFNELGRNNIAQGYAEKAKKYGELDAWGKKQVEAILE